MTIQQRRISKSLSPVFSLLICGLAIFSSSMGTAQSSRNFENKYPELAGLLGAMDVIQADVLDAIVDINNNSETEMARHALHEHLSMMSQMTMREMMAGGMNHNMQMVMNGPYQELERAERAEISPLLRNPPSQRDIERAFTSSDALPRHAGSVLQRGREFEMQLYEIYSDDSISNKQAAVEEAIEEYLSVSNDSVAPVPKATNLLLEHDQATAFQTGFPILSGFVWNNQWMQLAALEAIILAQIDPQFTGGLETVTERFWNKVGSAGGMSMFPAPSELPMVPAIAPTLYSQAPRAAIIIDNLNTLETIIADILAYPELSNRSSLIDAMVDTFVDKGETDAVTEDYLLFALRGGIYNQGGPAIGELTGSERNRSRAMMGMQHAMTMSSPQ